jgi:hypothetical protein
MQTTHEKFPKQYVIAHPTTADSTLESQTKDVFGGVCLANFVTGQKEKNTKKNRCARTTRVKLPYVVT